MKTSFTVKVELSAELSALIQDLRNLEGIGKRYRADLTEELFARSTGRAPSTPSSNWLYSIAQTARSVAELADSLSNRI